MKQVTWEEFKEKLNRIDFEVFDMIVAVADGGIIPAAMIQQKLKVPMEIVRINYRDDSHTPIYDDAKLLEKTDFCNKGKKLLLVDDVVRSGKTIAKAKEYLKGNVVRTCIVNGVGDYNLFNEKECIRMPWGLK